MRQYDVIVVGGGPAGSTTACLLARLGYSVALFDRATFPRDKSCAEYCSPGVSDVLLRAGSWPQVLSHVRALLGMDVWNKERRVLRIRYGDTLPRLSFSVRRVVLDNMLVEQAASAGVEVLPGMNVTAISRGETMVVTAVDRKMGTHQIAARVTVGADGAQSIVGRSLGVAVAKRWPSRIGLIAHVDGRGWSGVGEMHVASGAYCGLAPLPDGLLNVGLVVTPTRSETRAKHNLIESGLKKLPLVRERLEARPIVKPFRGVGPMAYSVRPVAGRGFLLVGDAAGFLDPFTGEGIFRALRGAELAAQEIHSQMGSGISGIPNLSRYALRRREEFHGKEMLTMMVQRALDRPRLFTYLASRIERNPAAARAMGNVLGDRLAVGELARRDVLGGFLTLASNRERD